MDKKYRIRFVPLGGIVGVTKNMYLYELYEGNALREILIVDCGVGFPEDPTKDANYLLPDIDYLRDKTDKIKAILFTHGHEDHISALRYYYKDLGQPPVYASKLTALFLEDKCKEMGLNVKVNVIRYKEDYRLGLFTANFFHLTHSIPDTTHILIKTPIGNFYHGSDFKFDLTPVYGPPPDFYSITKAGNEGILCLLSDCLGSENVGFTESEMIVGKTFDEEMRTTTGKFIMTTFSSSISRIRQCVEAAQKNGRKVCFVGRSMKQNAKIAMSIGYLPIPNNMIIEEDDIKKNKPSRLCLIVAGSQGQEESALSRIADADHRSIKISNGDKVLISSDPIPGQERSVYNLIERIYAAGAEVVYTDIHNELHASGHGNQEDLKMLARFTNPKFFCPIGGTIRHQRQYLKLCKTMGYDEKQVVLLNEGETVWFEKDKSYLGERIETKTLFAPSNNK